MNNPPLLDSEARRKDDEQLRLLSVFHYIIAGLGLLGIGFLVLHFGLMTSVFSDGWGPRRGPAPPAAVFGFLIVFYVVTGAALLTGSILNALSGVFLRQRKHRMFSLVVAGLDCLQVPFGTALGVFTIIVLQRDSVRESYGGQRLP